MASAWVTSKTIINNDLQFIKRRHCQTVWRLINYEAKLEFFFQMFSAQIFSFAYCPIIWQYLNVKCGAQCHANNLYFRNKQIIHSNYKCQRLQTNSRVVLQKPDGNHTAVSGGCRDWYKSNHILKQVK